MRRRMFHVMTVTWTGINRPDERTRLKRATWVTSAEDLAGPRPREFPRTDSFCSFHSHPYEIFRPWRA